MTGGHLNKCQSLASRTCHRAILPCGGIAPVAHFNDISADFVSYKHSSSNITTAVQGARHTTKDLGRDEGRSRRISDTTVQIYLDKHVHRNTSPPARVVRHDVRILWQSFSQKSASYLLVVLDISLGRARSYKY